MPAPRTLPLAVTLLLAVLAAVLAPGVATVAAALVAAGVLYRLVAIHRLRAVHEAPVPVPAVTG
ncbi:hypothetical protein [Klenkia brasiliensis]|uniref:Uncharacterized protein n=1 Tax=Klenkia brasiliensis TaxID=333142 RepID=A0A1G7SN74_9ACTN|nr:hypothetical protein [Klenkia brasiliensis]SDG24362.1 hypothetical protein SAMN05660324_2091 [Klenkia brasiliensis]